MDELLATIGSQAMKYAIRSGIALTSRYALGQCSRLLTAVEDEDIPGRDKHELAALQKLLESKIKVIAPTIDLVEFKSGRGNVFLDSAQPLTKSLHRDIVSLGERVEQAVADIEHTATEAATEQRQVKIIVADIKELLARIDREIPLLQLAITASGESLSSSLPPGTSPSRLLQASTLLTFGDSQFSHKPDQTVQIGPEFCLSLYMLFVGHAPTSHQVAQAYCNPANEKLRKYGRPYGIGADDRKPIWQEVIHKARVRLCRVPCQSAAGEEISAAEYSYHLDISEDKNDGRVHEPVTADPSLGGHFWSRKQTSQPQRELQCIKERIPVHQVSKIFYTDSGRLLNIGDEMQDEKKPVLLIKRDVNSTPFASPMGQLSEYRKHEDGNSQSGSTGEDNTQAEIDRQLLGEQCPEEPTPLRHAGTKRNGFPRHLDPEWIAMEMFEQSENEDEGESSSEASGTGRGETLDISPSDGGNHSANTQLESKVDRLSLNPTDNADGTPNQPPPTDSRIVASSPFGGITTSLSLIEMLIRLASLQEFQQASHLSIPDHILAFFLEETSTTGLVGEAQWKARKEAETRVGFDPYSDNPAGQK